jgi:hypothetical protein
MERFVTVAARSTRGLKEVPAYLYSHTAIIASGENDEYQGMILRVQSDSDIDYLAQYQSDRLASGLLASGVYPTFKDAADAIEDRFDIQINA